MTAKIIISDVETTGLKRPTNGHSGVVQVAWLEICPDTWQVSKERVELVNPGWPIEPGAQAVHGITEDMVKDKPYLEDVYKVEEPMYFVAHNVKFDYPRLAPGLSNCVGQLCTLEASRRWLRGQPNNKLVTLVDHFGLTKHKAHDALGDILMTAELLKYLVQSTGMTFKEMQKALTVPKIPLEMPFGKYKGKRFGEIPMPYIDFMLKQDIDTDVRKAFEMECKARGNF